MQSKWKRSFIFRKSLISLGALLLGAVICFGYVSEAPSALAQSRGDLGTFLNARTECERNGGTTESCEAEARAAVERTRTDDDSCNTMASCIAGVVYIFTVGIASLVAYAAAWMFSLSVALSLQSTAYALDFLSTAWTSVRDIANMFFILILVYIALTIMLRAETADTMKKLAWVIVIALLINFSFFFTRVVIDTGNLLAIQFYNAIDATNVTYIGTNLNEAPTQGTLAEAVPYTGIGSNTKDLTASIMNAVGVYTILNNKSFKAFQEENNGIGGFFSELILLIFVYVAAGIMFAMLAAAFFAIGVKFLFRIVVLWIVLFTAPLAFVANTIGEKGKKAYGMWQTALIGYSLYPAVFLFMYYWLTVLLQGLGGVDPQTGQPLTILGRAFGNINESTQVGFSYIAAASSILIIYLAIVLIFIYIALKAGDQVHKLASGSAFLGSGPADGFARWATRMGSNGLFGAAAFVGRRTIGAAGTALADSTRLRQMAGAGKILSRPGSNLFDRTLGRALQAPRNALQGIGRGSYDPRNLPGGNASKTTLLDKDYGLGKVNYDLGTPSSGGKVQQASEALKRRVNTQAPAPPFPTDGAGVPAKLGGPHTPPPLTAHATPESGKELVALSKIQKAVKELGGDLKHSASATEKLAETAAKPKVTHASTGGVSTELSARLEGVENALLNRANNQPKQIAHSPEKPMPVIDMTKNKEGVFEMVPEPKEHKQ